MKTQLSQSEAFAIDAAPAEKQLERRSAPYPAMMPRNVER